jgi:bifunctional ADP-heptose synthase (sugar kinase/adenylyltransferase)
VCGGREAGCPVVVDPKSRHFFDYRGATVFKPNQPELAAALREPVKRRRGVAGGVRSSSAASTCW